MHALNHKLKAATIALDEYDTLICGKGPKDLTAPGWPRDGHAADLRDRLQTEMCA